MQFLSLKNRSIFAQSLFFVAHFFVTSFSFAADDFFTGQLTTVSPLGHRRDMLLLKDAENKHFILKYNTKDYSYPTPEPSIHETLGAKIGMTAGININNVKLIPAYDSSLQSVDTHPQLPKTLHTVVPGKEVANSNIPYTVDIYGALDCKKNLGSLTHHKDLCTIAALDIFTSNRDRHNGNLFIDSKTNRFYAIDMDWIFNQIYNFPNDQHDKNKTAYSCLTDFMQPFQHKPFSCYVIATEVHKFLQNIDPKKLSHQEIEALKEVNATLQKLTSMYPQKKLFNEWMNIAEQAHYTYSAQKQQYIRYLIAYNYREISKVDAQINRIVSDHSILSYMQQIKNHATITWQTAKLHSGLAF